MVDTLRTPKVIICEECGKPFGLDPSDDGICGPCMKRLEDDDICRGCREHIFDGEKDQHDVCLLKGY